MSSTVTAGRSAGTSPRLTLAALDGVTQPGFAPAPRLLPAGLGRFEVAAEAGLTWLIRVRNRRRHRESMSFVAGYAHGLAAGDAVRRSPGSRQSMAAALAALRSYQAKAVAR